MEAASRGGGIQIPAGLVLRVLSRHRGVRVGLGDSLRMEAGGGGAGMEQGAGPGSGVLWGEQGSGRAGVRPGTSL